MADGSCNGVLGDDGARVLPIHVRSRMTLDGRTMLIRTRTYFLMRRVESRWSADQTRGILARGASYGLEAQTDKGVPRRRQKKS